jgi:hypothetical protein
MGQLCRLTNESGNRVPSALDIAALVHAFTEQNFYAHLFQIYHNVGCVGCVESVDCVERLESVDCVESVESVGCVDCVTCF